MSAKKETATLHIRGKEVSLPVHEGTFGDVFVDIGKLQPSTGICTFDPGYTSTGSCKSNITFINGGKGILLYRGYPIEQLVEGADFTDAVYLLLNGELPNKSEHTALDAELKSHTMVHEKLIKFYDGFKSDAHPMAIMVGVVGALSSFYDSKNWRDVAQARLSCIRLIAKMPTIAAIAYKTSIGQPIMYPRNDLSIPENFLYMMFGKASEPYKPDPILSRAMEVIMILHMDHEQNASTSTVRVAGSSQANPYACIASGIACLWGPSHGGANEAVLDMLQEITAAGGLSNIQHYINKVKDPKDPFRLMGFGHRVYKAYDPRAKIMRQITHQVFDHLKVKDPVLELAMELERIALTDEYFVKRNLYPNVDFYSGICLRAMGIPVSMFTVLFAVSRTVGWCVQWEEMARESARISRPRQIYTGASTRDFVPMNKRPVGGSRL
mmetsp:Transcript_36314/g.43904  ORF Transcript_36314/g.43904 Transcript_36314/m.43904 type:complete len:439 (+) Transcript_36314:95-1411(+)|eukprot:CAMPEP_0197845650 /NCGR_PEP_ID=MMETSP1438-20131217/2551_1 /TAXON_ID=1461541 /ORGANISM="Pterosperma sp., Strain CCMP1384" /LENGTH=438 /DNA_ID=CAMNT_0043457027 /DNA_START=98 /DNA_END=1414 /DNA_ORIENTATION=+